MDQAQIMSLSDRFQLLTVDSAQGYIHVIHEGDWTTQGANTIDGFIRLNSAHRIIMMQEKADGPVGIAFMPLDPFSKGDIAIRSSTIIGYSRPDEKLAKAFVEFRSDLVLPTTGAPNGGLRLVH